MISFDEQKLRDILNYKRTPKYVVRTLVNRFRIANSPSLDTWDYQWGFSCIFHKGLCITPRVNLVQNIGVIGSHSHNKTNDHFRNTESFPSEYYKDYLPKIEVYASYDDQIYSKRYYKNKLHWVIIIYLLRRLKLYDFASSLKRKLDMVVKRYS